MPTATFKRLRDEKQEAIMRAAIHEFVENGFARAKVSDIAQSAGIAKGSIFQYFEDKKELFVYCAEWGLEVFMKKLDAKMQIGDMDVFEYLQNNSATSEVMREEREVALFMQVAMNEPGLLDASMKSMYDIGKVYTKRLIQNSKDRGTVRKDIEDELLMEYFFGVTDRFSRRWMEMQNDFTAEQSTEDSKVINNELNQMIELLKKGMGC